MFIPYRADLEFENLPWITVAVCALCVWVYVQQASSDATLEPQAEAWCARPDHSRRFKLTVEKVTGTSVKKGCAPLLMLMHGSGRAAEIIPVLAEHASRWDTLSRAESVEYTSAELTRIESEFGRVVRPTLTARLVFDPAHSSFTRMFTAAVAHADPGHLIGNLFFFVAFAVLVEAVVGPVIYPLLLLELAFGTHVVYGLSQIVQQHSTPTLGLSGVVSGMIGLFAYFAPRVNIRCFAFFGFFWRTFLVPAWILAAWFIGWDVWNMVHDKGASNVNFVAHVSGAALGFLTGAGFLAGYREKVQAALYGVERTAALARGRAATARRAPPARPASAVARRRR